MTDLDFTSLMATKNLTRQDLNKKVYDVDQEITGSFKPALKLFKETMRNLEIVSTGFQEIDELLRGGIHSNHITQLGGLPESGKTTMIHKVLNNFLDNCNGNIFFLDSGASFSKERFSREVQHDSNLESRED